MTTNRNPGFYSNKFHNNGFTVCFPNGWTVSVQWHKAAYCNSYDDHSSANAEVAVWNSDGQWYDLLEDKIMENGRTDVLAYTEPEKVAQILEKFSKL